MARQKNDGRGRMGGRPKGAKNKPKPTVSMWAADLLNKHRGQVEQALACPEWNSGTLALVAALVAVAANEQDNTTNGEQQQ